MQRRLAVNCHFVWGPCNICEVKMTDNHCVHCLELTEHYWRCTVAVRWECHEACVHESRHTRYKFLADAVTPDANVAEWHRAFFWLKNEGKHIQKSILCRIMSVRFHCRMFSSCSVAILVRAITSLSVWSWYSLAIFVGNTPKNGKLLNILLQFKVCSFCLFFFWRCVFSNVSHVQVLLVIIWIAPR